MISLLRIKNVALIDEIEVAFERGLNVLTGETGAGKSIVVDSINFLLGEKPARDFIKSGEAAAEVEGLFEVGEDSVAAGLEPQGVFLAEDRQLIINRSLNAAGRSVCKINGRSATVGMLREVSALLADVHGQHEHQSLLDPKRQLHLLDAFCGAELTGLKEKLDAKLADYRENGRALKKYAGAGNQRETRLEIFNFQIGEIQKAKLSQGEEEALTERRTRLGALDRLNRLATEARITLAGESSEGSSASQLLGKAVSLLSELARIDASKAALAKTLAEASAMVTDAALELDAYADGLDADPGELERIEARLDGIYRIKKKYGPTVADALAFLDKTKAERDELLGAEGEINRLNESRREMAREIASACEQMTAIRKRRAGEIQECVAETLRELGMDKARFEIALAKKPTFGPDGNDRAEFLISPNPGEDLKPLNRIASGGEISRVMLALKSSLAAADDIGTLVFDEIDSGISGRTAQRTAEKLCQLSAGRQILCITHLAQIAAMADAHLSIEKTVEGDATVTSVRTLKRDESVEALARLTGGAEITEKTLKAAGEMKQMAESLKHNFAIEKNARSV